MSRRLIVDNLIADTRSMLDEDNRSSVKDEEDILPALNRAQDFASNILARHYESPLLSNREVTLVAGQQEYDIPEDAFEGRLEKVEVKVNEQFYEVERISYRDVSVYESQSAINIPYYYAEVGKKYRLLPKPSATYPLRIWYLVDPLPLVKQQGRINLVNAGSNYLIVDTAGSELTTETSELDSYINIIDGQSGVRKGTLQVKTISGNKITLKSSPARSSVLNLEVDTDLGDLSTGLTVSPDDYICLVHGSCVPVIKKPFSNFLIQYAVAEIRRKLGGPAGIELQVLESLEQQVERSWVGREQSRRVKKANNTWSLPVRRYRGNLG